MSSSDEVRLGFLKGIVQISMETNEALASIAELNRDIQDVSHRSQGIAAAAEEMVASVSAIAGNSETASQDSRLAQEVVAGGMQSAGRAVEVMDRITRAVEDAAGKVDALAEASNQIGSIVGQIEAIAKQTNLLALNATIEAARAGEAGKGFAVVAGEVKTLANQTAKATQDIRARIEGLRHEMAGIVQSMHDSAQVVETGSGVIAETGEQMSKAEALVTSVSAKMTEIAGILTQQQSASAEVAEGIAAIAAMATRNAENVGQVMRAMDRSDKVVQEELKKLSDLTDREAICTVTKSDHITFKKRVIEAVCGKFHLSAEELPDHHACRLGKWYDSCQDPAITSHPQFTALVDPHKAVHDHGKDALRHLARGDMTAALESVRRLDEASHRVIEVLNQLGRP